MSHRRQDALRERYRPRSIRLLLIGESRPYGGTFFYQGDSLLARYTAEAFDQPSASDVTGFLPRFKAQGAYLVDLCPRPVNHLARSERVAMRHAGVESLAEELARLQPRSIAIVMKAIVPDVSRAIKVANLALIPVRVLPFPAQGHQRKYVSQLRLYIRQLRQSKVLKSAS